MGRVRESWVGEGLLRMLAKGRKRRDGHVWEGVER